MRGPSVGRLQGSLLNPCLPGSTTTKDGFDCDVPTLNDDSKAFIAEQKIFFAATAPQRGRINLSPKGMDSFVCVDDRTVAFLNVTGSGNETAAHLNENGRLTLMFCSFAARPLILRLYGRGACIYPHHP